MPVRLHQTSVHLCGETFLQDAAEELAGVVMGQAAGLENPDVTRGFVGGQALAAPIE
jgi:hypothetical protein